MAPPEMLALLDAATGPRAGRTRRLIAVAEGQDPGDLSLGEAARRLIALRTRLLGPAVDALAHCPRCTTRAAVPIDLTVLAAVQGDPDAATLSADGVTVRLHPLTLGDLDAAATVAGEVAAVAAALAARAIERTGDAPLTPALCEAAEAALDRLDPLADPVVAIRCASCGHDWTEPLDLAALLAAEIEVAAQREARDVATLARAFGWSEREILMLSPARRRIYLEMAS